ncbi:prepilin peptidase [Actinoplanes sp. NPDC049265]|uniref:prepilin peptidase n=1 Tax=Actinoplanes sp. NPDC049265 TaxID=3363902 RepID=UPI0037106318
MLLLPALAVGVLLARADLRSCRLPDPLVFLLAVVLVLPVLGRSPGELMRGAEASIVVFTCYFVVALLPGDGMGFGDVKLAAVLAFALGVRGWHSVLVGNVLPPLIAGPAALAVMATRRDPLPYGPALLLGAVGALLPGEVGALVR